MRKYPSEKMTAELKRKLVKEFIRSKMTQKQLATITGFTQPTVSKIYNDLPINVSMERLIDALFSMGVNVEMSIVDRPKKPSN